MHPDDLFQGNQSSIVFTHCTLPSGFLRVASINKVRNLTSRFCMQHHAKQHVVTVALCGRLLVIVSCKVDRCAQLSAEPFQARTSGRR